MSESQFAYGHLTLDELRSLAASPQVGTMQAMPQSFHAIADRVGEVADLLTHVQADLPNWWKGPASEQAAATLGRAAAEAREFHESALGAATAVAHCAQVVTEQQNQMMNVPDVAEPGITDVVRRPTTPFEALEAARQDATYEAAHEQAVQVVNGIAAQYVETRGQLAEIGTFRAENFVPSAAVPYLPEAKAEPSPGSISHSTEPKETSDLQFHSPQYGSTAINPKSKSSSTRSQAPETPGTSRFAFSEPGSKRTDALSAIRQTVDQRAFKNTTGAPPWNNQWESNPQPEPTINTGHATPSALSDAFLIDEVTKPTSLRSEPTLNRPPSIHPEPGPQNGTIINQSERGQRDQRSIKSARRKDRHAFDNSRPLATFDSDHATTPSGEELRTSLPQNAYTPKTDQPSNDNPAMFPPFGSVGSAYRSSEERNRRPAYLKERKSVWLPDTVAAPADGVITPDWLERY